MSTAVDAEVSDFFGSNPESAPAAETAREREVFNQGESGDETDRDARLPERLETREMKGLILVISV